MNTDKDFDLSYNELQSFLNKNKLSLPKESNIRKEIEGNNLRIVEGVCSKTGIITAIIMPTVFTKYNLEYEIISPLAELKNVKRFISENKEGLVELDNNTLAGMVFVMYKHLGLFKSYEDSPIVSNGILATCDKETLIKALYFAFGLSNRLASLLPPLNIDLNTHKEGYKNFNPILLNQLILLKQEIQDIKEQALLQDKAKPVEEVNYTNPAYKKISSSTKSDYLVEFERNYIEAKALAREALRTISPVMNTYSQFSKSVVFLKSAIQGKNMMAVSKEIKDKLTLRLEEFKSLSSLNIQIEAQKIIDFISSSYNTESKDTSEAIADTISRFSDSLPKQTPKTIAEILALKKAQKEGN